MTEKTDKTDKTYLPWDEGLPTKPDVDLLVRTWPTPKVGDVFPYETIEKLLGKDRMDNRFRSVVTAWRRRMKRDGVSIYCQATTGYFVPTTAEVLAKSHGRLTHIGRVAGAHLVDLSNAKPDNNLQSDEVQHQGRLFHVIKREAKKARMNLLPPTAVAEPPRITPPKEAKA